MKKLILAVPLIILLTGCSQQSPKCGDIETVDYIKLKASHRTNFLYTSNQVDAAWAKAYKENNRKLDVTEIEKHFSYSVKSIRTRRENEKTGALYCAANLEVNNKERKEINNVPITYSVEVTDDKREVFISIYGLDKYEFTHSIL